MSADIPRVYVVECEWGDGTWVPITACGTTRQHAEVKRERNRAKYTGRVFRVSEYRRHEEREETVPLWAVECEVEPGKWEPTGSANLNLDLAKALCERLAKFDVSRAYRVVKYERAK